MNKRKSHATPHLSRHLLLHKTVIQKNESTNHKLNKYTKK